MQKRIELHPIPILSDNYVWTVSDPEKKLAYIVDPGESAPVLDYLQKNDLNLSGIIVTHHHWDHTNGIKEIAAHWNVPVIGPLHDNIPTITQPVRTHDVVTIDGFSQLTVLDIGGHTLGHVAYHGNGLLFCGDTLFSAGCGRIFEGTAPQMYESLQKLADLPSETKVCCAHEYTQNNLRFAEAVEPSNGKIKERMQIVADLRAQGKPSLPSTLKDEHATNPFLRCREPEIKANVEGFAGKSLDNEVEVFTWLRKWKDEFR